MKMCAKCGGSMKKGGATKKMAKGGVQKIVGMPGYNATTYPTTMKKGGAMKKMQPGGATGPSFKKGGSTSFGMLSVKAGVDKNPKATAADRIAGAKMKKK